MARSERVIAESAGLVERGAGVRFDIERDGKRVTGFVIRANGVVRGYVNVCAHQGLELDWTPLKFFDAEGRSPDLYCARRALRSHRRPVCRRTVPRQGTRTTVHRGARRPRAADRVDFDCSPPRTRHGRRELGTQGAGAPGHRHRGRATSRAPLEHLLPVVRAGSRNVRRAVAGRAGGPRRAGSASTSARR